MTLAELLVKIKVDKGDSESSIQGVGDKLKNLNILGIASAGAIGGLLVASLKACIDAAAESELVVSKLNAVLKATGGVSGVTSQAAQDLAKSLQDVTAFDDEAILSGETLLLTFRNIGENIFPQATEAALDLATVMGGDVSGAAKLLGKALDDPVQGMTALQRAGVRLSAAQKAQVEQFMALGEQGKAQEVVMGALAAKMGGAAKAAAETYSGRLAQLDNAFGDLKETIGNMFIGKGGEGLTGLTTVVKEITEGFNKIQIVYAKFQVVISNINKAMAIGDRENYNALKAQIAAQQALNDALGIGNKGETKKGGTFQPSTDENATQKKAKDDLLKLEQDFQAKRAQLDRDGLAQINIEEAKSMADLKATLLSNTIEGEQTKTNIAKYYADLRAAYEQEQNRKIQAAALTGMQTLVSGLANVYSMYLSNKNMELDNELYTGNERIQAEYDAQKLKIESTVLDEREKAAQLKALDEKKARDTDALNKKTEKDKRKAAREAAQYQKIFSITQIAITTAQGIAAAWATAMQLGPYAAAPYGIAMTAMLAALAAAQTALIVAQPLPAAASGGVFNTPYIGGEAGAEMAVPLTGSAGQTAIQALASGILDVMSQSVDNRATISNTNASAGGSGGNVYLDGSMVGTWLSKASGNGLFSIDKKVVI
jgi:hypothetical protein